MMMDRIRLSALYIYFGILFLHQLVATVHANIRHLHEMCDDSFDLDGDSLYLYIDSDKIERYTQCIFTVKLGGTNYGYYRNNLIVEWLSVDSGQVSTGSGYSTSCRPVLRMQLDKVCIQDNNIQSGKITEYRTPIRNFRISLVTFKKGYLKATLKIKEKEYKKTTTTKSWLNRDSTTTEMPNEELSIGPIMGIVIAVTAALIFCTWCCRKCCCDDKEGDAETNIALAPIANQNETVHVYPASCNQPARRLAYPNDPTHPYLPQPNVNTHPSNYTLNQNLYYDQNQYPQNLNAYFPNPYAAPIPPHAQSQYPPAQPPYPPTAQYAPHSPYSPLTDSQNVPPSIQPPPTDFSAPPPSYDSVMNQQSHETPSAPAYEQ